MNFLETGTSIIWAFFDKDNDTSANSLAERGGSYAYHVASKINPPHQTHDFSFIRINLLYWRGLLNPDTAEAEKATLRYDAAVTVCCLVWDCCIVQ